MEIDVGKIVYICGVITSIAAAVTVIIGVLKKAIKKVTEDTIKTEVSSLKESFDEQLKALNEKLLEYRAVQDNTDEVIKKALLSTTRDRINQVHDIYMEKQYIGAHSLFVIEELYTSYKALGGNSFIDRQMEDIRGLEVRSAEMNNRK